MTEANPQTAGDIVARVDFQYRWRSWVFAILMLAVGLWCLHDGFVVYPRDNATWEKMADRVDRPQRPPHDVAGVWFNQAAGIICTSLAVPFLIWREYRSRGEYRLSGSMLHLPGTPPIDMKQIQSLDLVRWDRKGIAMIECELASGKRRLTINDMIYQRQPTDTIVKRIEQYLASLDAGQPTVSTPPATDSGTDT